MAGARSAAPSHTTHNTQHTTHNTQHTTHNTQHTTHNTQHTTHNTQHITFSQLYDPRIKKVIAMLTDDPGYQWQVSELAEAVSLSTRQLRRLFQAATSTKLLPYLRQLRLAKACELLSVTSELIYKIAEKVGISDPKAFRRAFKQAYSVSPSGFRKRRKEKMRRVQFSPRMAEISPLSKSEQPLT